MNKNFRRNILYIIRKILIILNIMKKINRRQIYGNIPCNAISTSYSHSHPQHRCTHQKPSTAFDMTQSYRYIQEHDSIADYNSVDITLAFTIKFIFNAPFSSERNGQVWMLVIFHKINKPKG